MPIYDLKCCNCGRKTEAMLSVSELSVNSGTHRDAIDLREVGIICRCGGSIFAKLLSIPAKMAYNWSSWQRT